jgi:type III pantothenate kinase
MNALLMDIGNTRLKWGLLDGGAISRTGHITHKKIHDRGITALTSNLPRNVDTAFASNVAGTTFATRLTGVLGAHCGCDVHFATTDRKAFGVTNSYRQPRRMGVDRWVAMIGAWSELQTSCLIVDVGTAVTIDVLDHKGQHLGGQIVPGVRLMAKALTAETSDIPTIGRRVPNAAADLEMFADNTAAAVRHGAWAAVAGAVERAIKTLRSNSYKPTLVLTGGDASRMLTALGDDALHRPHLVLQGLAHMLEGTR